MHGAWKAVDLDGTLAVYEHFEGPDIIGEPVPKMVARVKKWLENGDTVKIFTARVGPGQSQADRLAAHAAIVTWCKTHIGQELEVTWEKDYKMVELWDDRCVQIIPNTGERADGREDED